MAAGTRCALRPVQAHWTLADRLCAVPSRRLSTLTSSGLPRQVLLRDLAAPRSHQVVSCALFQQRRAAQSHDEGAPAPARLIRPMPLKSGITTGTSASTTTSGTATPSCGTATAAATRSGTSRTGPRTPCPTRRRSAWPVRSGALSRGPYLPATAPPRPTCQPCIVAPLSRSQDARSIKSLYNGKCLDISHGKDLVMWDCHGGHNQKFYVLDLLARTPRIAE
jgi:hypothetical protein